MSGVPSWCFRGARVVCIAAGGNWVVSDGPPDDGSAPEPRFGETYTIRKIAPWRRRVYVGLVGYADDYDLRFFRPATEDDVEAELFRAKRTPAGERADA